MLYRLRNNFQLCVITLMSACAVVGITPFGFWRLMRGDWLIALIDLGIILGILGALAYSWRTDDTARTGFFLAVLPCTGGAIAVATLAGEQGLFWLFPALICSFLLTKPWIAVIITLSALMFLVLHDVAFTSYSQMWSFTVTIIVVSCCVYAFALRSENQRKRLEQLALLDPLTGVKNRRSMDEELNRAVADQARNKTHYGLALADLDHFKAINDEHGHGLGDKILVDFVTLLDLNTRRADQIFRFGGEEFVLLLPNVDEKSLQAAMEHLLAIIQKTLHCPSGAVTASFGTALLQADDNAEQWLARADSALYEAKQRGRNCVVAADLEVPLGPSLHNH